VVLEAQNNYLAEFISVHSQGERNVVLLDMLHLPGVFYALQQHSDDQNFAPEWLTRQS